MYNLFENSICHHLRSVGKKENNNQIADIEIKQLHVELREKMFLEEKSHFGPKVIGCN